MKEKLLKALLVVTVLFGTASAFAGVTISSPASGSTVGTSVHFVASASGASAISAIIVYVDYNEVARSYSGNLDQYVSLGNGGHNAVVKAWDNSGNVYSASSSFTVGSSTSTSTSTGSLSINVSSPAAGASLSSPVHLLASASGATRMSAYLDGTDVWDTSSGTLDGWKAVGSGSHTVVFKAWDSSGNVSSKSVGFSIGGSTGGGGTTTTSPSGATTRYNMQSLSGWNSCSACAGAGGNGPVASYYMSQFQSSPSLTGSSTKYAITGGPSYADVLWYHSVIPSSVDPSINKNTSHFIYDTYFYINNGSVAQALEFDVNQYVNGAQLIWGTQCNIRGGNHWDIYDNRNWKWVSTGIYCPTPSSNTWHHVILEVERDTSNNWLHYISISLDGNKHYIDAWYGPTTSSWNVSTINFQMDLDGSGDPYAVWLDKLNVTYW